MLDGRLDEAGAMFDEAIRMSPTYYGLASRNARKLEKIQRVESPTD